MKKLVFFIMVSILIIVVLITSAFLYFYLHTHRTYLYNLYYKDQLWGESKVDRYNTEGKIIYKSDTKLPYTTEFSQRNEKYFLKKTTLESLKYSLELSGVYGQKETILMQKEEDNLNYLFLRTPEFVKIKEAKLGRYDTFFSPRSIVSHMAVLEKYNFWKKGVQYIDVVIPVEGTVSPVETRIEVRHLGDQYVNIMGRKIESEILSFNSDNFRETKVFVSKYSHEILMFKIHEREMKWILKNAEEGSDKILKFLIIKSKAVLSKCYSIIFEKEKSSRGEEDIEILKKNETKTSEVLDKKTTEVFFESSNLVLSGQLYKPEGEGPFPSIIMVPDDGPLTNGELKMFGAMCDFLSNKGYMCLFFQRPGQGKSQGVFAELDDERNCNSIIAAHKYLLTLQSAKKDSMFFMGYHGGGYLSLKASKKIPESVGCILINPLIWINDVDLSRKTVKSIESKEDAIIFSSEELVKKEKEFIENVKNVLEEKDKVSYFLGNRLSYEGYKEYLTRDILHEMASSKNKIFIVAGKDDPFFSQVSFDELESNPKKSEGKLDVSIFRFLGGFVGDVAYRDNRWVFDFKKDVFELIADWIDKMFPNPVEVVAGEDINSTDMDTSDSEILFAEQEGRETI